MTNSDVLYILNWWTLF